MPAHRSTRASASRRRLGWVLLALSAVASCVASAMWAFEPGTGCGTGPEEFARIDRVESAAMAPILVEGDFVLVHRRSYCHADPRRGDLAVVASPRHDAGPLILRVVGLPGDRVELRRGQFILNGAPIEHAWLESAIHDDEEGTPRQATRFIEQLPEGPHYEVQLADLAAADETVPPLTVPPGQYFLLGDNRDAAEDSRAFGTLARSAIVDRPWRIVWSESWDRLGRELQ